MAGLVELARPTVEAAPGREAAVGVLVYNTGSDEESFRLEVLGPVGTWSRLDAAEVSVPGGDSREVRLVIRPPRSPDVPAGPTPFTVRLTPASSPAPGQVVEELAEATVDVGAFEAFAARVVPEDVEAGLLAHPRVEIRNEGNVPMMVAIEVRAGDGLEIDAEEPTVLVPAGTIAGTRLRAKPTQRRLVGHGTPLAYRVELESLGQTAVLAGRVTPKGALLELLVRGVGVLAALAVLVGAGLWIGGAFDDPDPGLANKGLVPRSAAAPDDTLPPLPSSPEPAPRGVGADGAPAPGAPGPGAPPASTGTIPAAPAAPAQAGPIRPLVLRRIYDPALVDYLYASDDAEIAGLLGQGFVDQGPVGKVASGRASGTVALYRLRAPDGRHTVTFDESERKSLLSRGFKDEAIAGYLYPTPVGGTLAVYRLVRGDNVYLTTDPADAQAKSTAGFVSQGVRGYVLA